MLAHGHAATGPAEGFWHHGPMTKEEVIQFVSGLADVDVVVASEANGAPEMAWGDIFFYYDPKGDVPADRTLPFATIVVSDYPGFDTASNLDRAGVFRVNVAAGRHAYEEVLGHPPAAHKEHHASYDYAVLDRLIPHPVYAVQGWVSVLNPGAATDERLRSLLTDAHARAAERHHRRR
jgi:hypothetical protein